jgi:hypothetical protein
MSLKPPRVTQELSASCWAACMVSLSRCSWRVAEYNTYSQGWYYRQWGPGYPTGGLDYHSDDFDKFRNYFGFAKSVKEAKGVTEDMVWGWLGSGDYFILIEKQAIGSHARLAYDWAEGGIKVMDPAKSGGASRVFPDNLNQVVVLYW